MQTHGQRNVPYKYDLLRVLSAKAPEPHASWSPCGDGHAPAEAAEPHRCSPAAIALGRSRPLPTQAPAGHMTRELSAARQGPRSPSSGRSSMWRDSAPVPSISASSRRRRPRQRKGAAAEVRAPPGSAACRAVTAQRRRERSSTRQASRGLAGHTPSLPETAPVLPAGARSRRRGRSEEAGPQ